MKAKFYAITNEEIALEAVKSNGYALRYVLSFDIFEKVCKELGIDYEKI